jgi:hypothetical protein
VLDALADRLGHREIRGGVDDLAELTQEVVVVELDGLLPVVAGTAQRELDR